MDFSFHYIVNTEIVLEHLYFFLCFRKDESRRCEHSAKTFSRM